MAGMNQSEKLTIVAFGDSITQAVEVAKEQRWPALLEVALNRQNGARSTLVVNRGIGGNTSREGLARMEEVLCCEPDFVLVEFGGNDTTDEAARHVSVEEFVCNLGAMREQIGQAGATMILLTLPPVNNDQSTHNAKSWHRHHGSIDEHVELYRQSMRIFAFENQLLLIDIDRALRHAVAAQGWAKYFQSDGVHLTRGGNEIVGETVLQSLLEFGLQ